MLTAKSTFRSITSNARHHMVLWSLGCLAVAYFYAYFAAMTTGDTDVAQCQELGSAVTAKHTIPPSVSWPVKPAIFCDWAVRLPFLYRYQRVYVYGVVDAAAQDGIVATLSDFRLHHHGRIRLEFFTKENWITWSDPATGLAGGRRGPETPIRDIWIK